MTPITVLIALALWGLAIITAYALSGRSGRRRDAVTLAIILSWLGVVIFVIADATGAQPPPAIPAAAAEDVARAALDQGTPRADLPMAAQLAYDRLTAQDSSRHGL